MQITAPFGYSEIVPLMRDHKVKFLEPPKVPDFVRETNSLPLTLSEVTVACHDYPIAFVQHGPTDFAMVGVVGLATGENLFVDENGWVPGHYHPAYARRFPLCMTRVAVDGKQQARRVICIEKSYISEDGRDLFSGADPVAKAHWVDVEKFLNDYELDLENTVRFCNILRDFKLLMPVGLKATVAGREMSLTGMFGIDTDRLNALNSSEIKTLFRSNALATIHMHMASINRFARLIERKMAKDAAAVPAA